MELRNELNVRQELGLAKIVIVSSIIAGVGGIIFFLASTLGPSTKSFAAGVNRYAVANGAWNSTATWSASSGGASGASIPVAGDFVFLGEGSTARAVTIPSGYTAACATIAIGSGSYATANSISLSSATSTLNVSGNLTINRSSGATINALNVNAGIASVGGILTLAGTNTTSTRINKIVISTGSLAVAGNLIVAVGTTTNNIIDMSGGSGFLYLGGTFNAQNCGFLKGTGTVVFDGTIVQTINFPTAGYNNLSINNTNILGAILSTAITTTNVTGNLAVGDIDDNSLLSTGSFSITLNNSKTLTVDSGSTLNALTSRITFGTSATATINGTFMTSNLAGFSGSTTTALTSTNAPSIILGSNSEIEYIATSAQTITARTDYENLTITSGSKTIGSGTLTLSQDLVIATGAIYLGSTNNPNLNIGGDFTNNGTFTQGSGLVTFNGSGSQTIGGTSTTTFNSLTINNSYNIAPQIALESSITISGTLTLTDGIISIDNNNMVMASGSSLSGGSSTAFVCTGDTGVFKWMSCAASTTRIFPVGLNSDASGYSPIELSFNSGHTTDNYSVSVDSLITTTGRKSGSPITTNVVKATWNISETVSGGSNLNFKFQWGSAREKNVNRNKDCQLLHYSSGSWDRPSGKKARINGSTSAYITFSGYTGTFSPFGVEGDDGSVALSFTGTPSVSGTAGAVGTKYTWNNVGTAESVTIKAVIEIISKTGGALLENIDDASTGSADAWQPIVNGSNTNGNCWAMEFRVRFYNASTNARLTLTSFKAQGIDIDGDDEFIREYNRFDKLSEYAVESNTYLTTTFSSGNYTFKGPTTAESGIDLTKTRYNVTCIYANTDSMNVVLGGCCDGGDCETFMNTRRHSINFLNAITYVAPVPVVMIYFNGETIGEAASLTWATATEINNSHFDVFRSADGQNWTKIGRVEGNGNSNKVLEYDFTDNEPMVTNYYKLKQVDFDGKFEFSNVKIVDFEAGKISFQAYPNPTHGAMTIDINRSSIADGIRIEIMDIQGNIVKEMNFDPDGSQNLNTPIDISFCKNGLYIIRVISGETIESLKITKF